ncbi:uncharacterized protein si:ch211-79k12.1 [Hippoglossus hippoglossus]|uniref:uncharacterized protein si:ch211-79k12.1 n=1 Tax=Hippoglossus hippoglossus TaxID=8267 RepID=UPI00148DD841|nr:uncharacterized protein si:ch211-79k12.1 [Hippoglossus hippoglossus]
MKVLLVAAVVVLIHGSYATLLIKGPTQLVLEGDRVTLECSYSDSELNISQVHFEVFSKYLQGWHQIYERSLVLLLDGNRADNMGEVSLTREGYTRYLGVPKDLKVQLRDDVVLKCSASSSEELSYFWHKKGSDWILPSSTLTLKKVSAEDEGEYTCRAQNPAVESLSKKQSVRITVLPEDAPWYESSNGRLILMTSAAAVALLVFILSVSVFLCRRAKHTKTIKGPIDDHSQKKPIYRGSSESLPSACGDKQPLV